MSNPKTFDEFLNLNLNPRDEGSKVIMDGLKSAFALEVTCLPCDDPLEGQYGFVLFRMRDAFEDSIIISRQVAPKTINVQVTSKQELEKIYNEAIMTDWLVDRYDDPKSMKLGFIVSKG